MTYVDSLGNCPKEYSDRNLISYYVQRNIEIIKHLQKQKWVSSYQLVVAGHSEVSSVAAKMAAECNKITHLIYAGGSPLGRIMSIVGQRGGLAQVCIASRDKTERKNKILLSRCY
jgi:hypothetical protein